MTGFLRVIFLIVGLFLIALALASLFDILAGGLSTTSLAYLSPLVGSTAVTTATLQDVSSFSTETFNAPTATLVVAFTPTPVPANTSIPTAQVIPIPGIFPTGTPPAVLGSHTIQSGEYLFCIGRAYGVAPEAIAKMNSIPVDAILLPGKELLIPDVPWVDIPAGRTCRPQFASRDWTTVTPTLPVIGGQFSGMDAEKNGSSSSGELQLVGFVLRNLVASTPTPVPVAETRTIEVDLPAQMRLGGSGQVQLIFNSVSCQSEGTVATASAQTQVVVTDTAEPVKKIYSSNPLDIPDLFGDYRIYAVARLDAAGFEYSPKEDVQQQVTPCKKLTWRWSIQPQDAEHQELIIKLRLHFEPRTDQDPRPDDEIWSDSFEVNVTKNLFASLFGTQASFFTGFTFITGGIISIFSIWDKIKPGSKKSLDKQ